MVGTESKNASGRFAANLLTWEKYGAVIMGSKSASFSNERKRPLANSLGEFDGCLEENIIRQEEDMPMGRDEFLTFSGTVTAKLPNGMYRVSIEDGQEVLATVKGKLGKLRFHMMVGDGVDLEVSPYDLSKGRITRRHD